MEKGSRLLGAAAVTVTVSVMMTGCSGPAMTQPVGEAGSCPEAIARLVDPGQAAGEINASVDKTKSFFDGASADSSIAAQVKAIVAKAIDTKSALRVSVFTGSIATVLVAVECRSMAARFNNEKAAGRRTAHLKEVAAKAVLEAVVAATPRSGGQGSSVGGAWAALAESAPLAASRTALMLSDGRGPLDDLPVDLGGYDTVGMYNIERVQGRSGDTAAVFAATSRWTEWLIAHGAKREGLTVTSGEYR